MISNKDVKEIFEGLKQNYTLTKVEMGIFELTSEGEMILAEILHSNKNLKEFELSIDYIIR